MTVESSLTYKDSLEFILGAEKERNREENASNNFNVRLLFYVHALLKLLLVCSLAKFIVREISGFYKYIFAFITFQQFRTRLITV